MPSYDPAHYAQLSAVEDRHFWFRARNRIIAAALAPIARSSEPGSRFLEVGCGTGNVLRTLADANPRGTVVGLDPHPEGLRIARRRTDAPLIRGDACALPVRGPFSVVGVFDALEYVEDDLDVLASLRRVLAPDGSLLLTVPAHRSLWSYFDVASGALRRYEEGDLLDVLARAGYRVEYSTPIMAAILPLVWLGRRLAALRERGSPPQADRANELAFEELRIVPVVNPLLTFLLGQEARFVARRRRVPFGASLLVVARSTT